MSKVSLGLVGVASVNNSGIARVGVVSGNTGRIEREGVAYVTISGLAWGGVASVSGGGSEVGVASAGSGLEWAGRTRSHGAHVPRQPMRYERYPTLTGYRPLTSCPQSRPLPVPRVRSGSMVDGTWRR